MARDPIETAKVLADLSGDQSKALPVGAVGFDEHGQLTRKKHDGQYDFQFAYMGYQFAVRAETEPDHTRMRVHAFLGHLPYTAESPELRINLRAVVVAAGQALGGRIHVTRKQRVMFFDEFNFDETLTPTSLLSKTVAFLLAAKPYFELMQLISAAADTQTIGLAKRA